jgi:hypothetical protein
MTPHRDDDALVADLSRLAARYDPVPAKVVTAARQSFQFVESCDWDAELATLTYDSSLDDHDTRALVRAHGTRDLTFEASQLTVELQVRAGRSGGPRQIVGQLVPAQAGRIEVRHPEGSFTVEVSPRGRFATDAAPAGPMSLRCTGSDDAVTTTEWVTI